MKKNELILWLASFIITFLSIYIFNLLDKNYPITGTFGIEGEKVSYRFEKVHYGKDDFSVVIRSDVKNLSGKLFWKSYSDSVWLSSQLKTSKMILEGSIKSLKPLQTLEYFVELKYKDKTYRLPDNKKVLLLFFGKIPTAVNVLQFLFIYIGLLLAIRTGLEFFNNNKKTKKFSMLTVILFVTLLVLINPLYLTYKFGYINSSIPTISKLFPVRLMLVTLLWIISMIVSFRYSRIKYITLAAAVITIFLLLY